MAWILLLILSLTQSWGWRNVVKVDRAEINVVLCETGEIRFTQIILWRWSSQLHRFLVAEWQMLPYGYCKDRGDVIRWRNAEGRTFRVNPTAFLITRGHDREVEERANMEQSERTPYFVEE